MNVLLQIRALGILWGWDKSCFFYDKLTIHSTISQPDSNLCRCVHLSGAPLNWSRPQKCSTSRSHWSKLSVGRGWNAAIQNAHLPRPRRTVIDRTGVNLWLLIQLISVGGNIGDLFSAGLRLLLLDITNIELGVCFLFPNRLKTRLINTHAHPCELYICSDRKAIQQAGWGWCHPHLGVIHSRKVKLKMWMSG